MKDNFMEMDTLIFKGIDFPQEPYITNFSMQSLFTKGGAGKGSSTGKGKGSQSKPLTKSPTLTKTSFSSAVAGTSKKSSSARSSD